MHFQMEFGIDDRRPDLPKLYQARIFRPFEPRGDFSTGSSLYGTGFGVTPQEGIVLPLRHLHDRSEAPSARYFHAKGDSAPLEWQPPSMEAYIAPNFSRDKLDHGDFRFLQRAGIVSCGSTNENDSLFQDIKKQQPNVRIKSNGITSSVKEDQ